MRKRKLMVIPLVLVLLASAAQATVYKYVDENGVTHFTDQPKNAKYQRVELWDNDPSKDPPENFIDPVFTKTIQDAAAYYKVDPAMIKAMIRVESNFNPRAVSPKGAMGLMQLMPATASRLGVSDAFNPTENIWAGTYYVKCLIVKFSYNYDYVFAAYNAGENAVAKYNGIPPYRETQNYVKKCHYYWRVYRSRTK